MSFAVALSTMPDVTTMAEPSSPGMEQQLSHGRGRRVTRVSVCPAFYDAPSIAGRSSITYSRNVWRCWNSRSL